MLAELVAVLSKVQVNMQWKSQNEASPQNLKMRGTQISKFTKAMNFNEIGPKSQMGERQNEPAPWNQLNQVKSLKWQMRHAQTSESLKAKLG